MAPYVSQLRPIAHRTIVYEINSCICTRNVRKYTKEDESRTKRKSSVGNRWMRFIFAEGLVCSRGSKWFSPRKKCFKFVMPVWIWRLPALHMTVSGMKAVTRFVKKFFLEPNWTGKEVCIGLSDIRKFGTELKFLFLQKIKHLEE